MPDFLRHVLVICVLGLALTACGRTVQEEAPEAVTAELEEEGTEDGAESEEGEFAHLVDLMRTFRTASGQAGMVDAVNQARLDGYSDQDIASGMGLAYFWAPGRRVLISVVFVRFKSESAVPAEELDAAFEYAATPPRLRQQEADDTSAEEEETAAEEEEAEEDEEEEPRRRRGWFRWIPGL